MSREPEIIWLTEERTFAVLISMGAYYSKVRYTREGFDYETYVSNDEFIFWEEGAFYHE